MSRVVPPALFTLAPGKCHWRNPWQKQKNRLPLLQPDKFNCNDLMNQLPSHLYFTHFLIALLQLLYSFRVPFVIVSLPSQCLHPKVSILLVAKSWFWCFVVLSAVGIDALSLPYYSIAMSTNG